MKKHTQTDTFLIVGFALILFVMVLQLIRIGFSFTASSIVSLLSVLLLLFCLFTFYKLAITIDGKNISFKFGIGWFGKSYPLSEIESCRPVRNRLIYGIGIRWIGKGWLYNVWGLKAVELRFKNKKSIVRIGTDRPEEICEAVRKMIS